MKKRIATVLGGVAVLTAFGGVLPSGARPTHLGSPIELTAPDTIHLLVPIEDHFGLTTAGWSYKARGCPPPATCEVTTVQHVSWNGNGWVRMLDPNKGDGLYWLAPSKYYGDQHRLYGRRLQYRLASNKPSISLPYTAPRAMLVGEAGDSLYYWADMLDGPTASPLLYPVFRTYSIVLDRANWRTQKRLNVTLEHFCRVLRNLSGIMILAEFTKEPETDALDDVIFGAGPGPAPRSRNPCG